MALSLTSSRTHLRLSSITEGISFLVLLFIAMPLKYMADMPEWVRVTGMIHGVLFIWYVGAVLWARVSPGMSWRHTLIALIASVLPFGTFYADSRIFSRLPETAA